jgi:predicted RNase H-like HicB family nuclease
MRAYTVNVHEAEEGGYCADVEELPGCFGSGETLDELERDIKDAIESYILALEEAGTPIPPGHQALEPNLRRWEIAVA